MKHQDEQSPGWRFSGRYQIESRSVKGPKCGLLFFVGDVVLVEMIHRHRFLHMTRAKELQKVSLELIGEV